MELFLVRHAIAEPYAPGRADQARALTPEGRARFQRCVAGLERLGVELDLLLHSPLVRAVQTADELSRLLVGESRVTPALAEPPTAGLLDGVRGAESAALVGHEPWMSDLLGLCLGGGAAPLPVAYKKGAVAWLRGEPTPGALELVAFLPPRVLVKL